MSNKVVKTYEEWRIFGKKEITPDEEPKIEVDTVRREEHWTCDQCNGTGENPDKSECEKCHGTGSEDIYVDGEDDSREEPGKGRFSHMPKNF